MTDAVVQAEPLGALVEDYARQPVPAGASVGVVRIAMILMGMAIALPAFVLGGQLGSGLGISRMTAACLIGGAILAAIAMCSAVAGARSRLSTYLLISAAFGRTGGKFVNALIGVSLLGWFGVIAMMFGRSAAQIAGQLSSSSAIIAWAGGGAMLMMVSALVGFRALDRLSAILTPVKAVLLIVTAAAAIRQFGTAAFAEAAHTHGMALGDGVTLVVGSLAISAAVQPDISRYAQTPLRAAIASGLVFAIGFPAVLILAGIPGMIMRQPDIVAIMIALGLGLPAMATVLLAAWTNNTYNLYASSLVLSTILVRQPRWALTLVVGAIGTAFGLMGISDHIVPYLVVLSVVIPPIAGVYLANFYLAAIGRRTLAPDADWRWAAVAAWLAGAGFAGLEAWRGFAVAGIPALDSLLLAALAYLPLRQLENR